MLNGETHAQRHQACLVGMLLQQHLMSRTVWHHECNFLWAIQLQGAVCLVFWLVCVRPNVKLVIEETVSYYYS